MFIAKVCDKTNGLRHFYLNQCGEKGNIDTLFVSIRGK